MTKYPIEIASCDKSRGVVVLTEGTATFRSVSGLKGSRCWRIQPAFGTLLAGPWPLALADEGAPDGSHIHMHSGPYLLTPNSESLMLGRSDGLGSTYT